jgi:hypothetical protein
VATEKLQIKLSNVGENLLFPESYTERLSQKHLMFAHNIKMILTTLYTQLLGKTTYLLTAWSRVLLEKLTGFSS